MEGKNMIGKLKTWGKVVRVEEKIGTLRLFGDKEKLKIEVLSDRVLRFHFSKDREWKHEDSFVIGERPRTDFTWEETPAEVILRTRELKVVVNKEKHKIKIYDAAGNLLHGDYKHAGYGRFKNQVLSYKKIREEEAFLGLGERIGGLNKKGKKVVNWNTDEPNHHPGTDPLYQAHPFLLAWNPRFSYGLYFDNSFRSYLDLGKENESYYYFCAEDGELDYYFIYGPTPKEVVEAYTALTGRCYLPPLWALGYQQSKWGYTNEEEVLKIAATFREKQIPCDVIYLDIDYMDGFRVFSVSDERFPNFQEMLKTLAKDGFKVVPIIDPGVKKDINYELYKEGISRNYFCKRSDGTLHIGYVWPGESAFPDFTREKVREWWGEKQKKLLDLGVAGIWNDMNEPASFTRPINALFDKLEGSITFWGKPQPGQEVDWQEKTFPADVLHGDSQEYTHLEIHNLYGMLMAKASFEGWKKARPNRRPLIITRAGFAGVQKYSAVWTGDNSSWWEHLYMSLPMLQNLSLSGVPFVGADLGGFFSRDCTPELFIRWIELGIFYPFCRNHSDISSRNQEPWSYGEKTEKIVKKYIQLRYRMLPYLYSLFREAGESGIPPLRAMLLEFPADPETIACDDQFMLGSSLLVAPVCREGARARLVYFPAGDWYDFWSGKKYSGPGYFPVPAPLETIPLFVRAGTALPLFEVQNFVGEKPQETLELKLYPGEGEFRFYEDDGFTWNYQKGKFNLIKLSLGSKNLKIEYLHKQYASPRKNFKIVPLKGKPAVVEDTGNCEVTIPVTKTP